jgi:hypothetical protein
VLLSMNSNCELEIMMKESRNNHGISPSDSRNHINGNDELKFKHKFGNLRLDITVQWCSQRTSSAADFQ